MIRYLKAARFSKILLFGVPGSLIDRKDTTGRPLTGRVVI